MTAQRSPLYHFTGGALLRTTTDPGGLRLPDDPDAHSENVAWLERVWHRSEVRDAVQVASPALAARICEILAGQRLDARRVRRAVLSLASYLLRWQQRPTPFGLFAGIAPLHVGDAPAVSWGTEHTAVARADAAWLSGVIAHLHQSPELVERLPVVASGTGQVRGGRWVMPGVPADERPLELAPIEVSVRSTPPVAAALTLATAPVRYSTLRSQLAERFPAAPAARIDAMLSGLVAQNILLTSLWAPMTATDPLGHLRAELQSVDAAGIGGISTTVRELSAIHEHITARPPRMRDGVAQRMNALCGTSASPLSVDTAVNCDVQIPDAVVREAEDAAAVLCRLSPYPFGSPAWRDYHGRFRARYGMGAVVPVLELVADSGLGFPAGYLDSPYEPPQRRLTERDETLLRLVQQAAMDGSGEIVLTKSLIEELAADADGMAHAPRAEVSVEVHATTVEELARGAFRLVVTGTPRTGSSMAGRFAHLLPPGERAKLADTYRATAPEAVAAQLSFPPRRRRNDNVARTARLLPHVISLGEHRPPDDAVIPVSDLAVTADSEQFWLVQSSTGRRVEPRVPHALEAAVHTPPLARFLAEVATARCAVYRSFDFGAAARLPYLPRVRYGRSILAQARWLLTARDLPRRTVASEQWDAQLAACRTRLSVPDRVTLVEHDQRLPVDLTHPVHRRLLRNRLDSARRLELREAPEPGALGWLGRPHELLFPLVRPASTSPGAPVRLPVRRPEGGDLPGRSRIVQARLHAHPGRFDELLTGHLPELIDTFEEPPCWWFSRHRATTQPGADQHLVLCLKLPSADGYGPAAEVLHSWAAALRSGGLLAQLTLTTYEPPTGHWGHSRAMEAAQTVFAADSAAAVAQIHTAALTETNGQALAAASMVDLATRLAPSTDSGLRWLASEIPREHGPLDRYLRDQALALADSHRSAAAGNAVAEAWHRRAAALGAYRAELAPAQRDPLTVLSSLIHLHHVRALGIDADRERITNRLVRACALRHLAGRSR